MVKTATLAQVKERVEARNRHLRDEVISSKSLFMDPTNPGRMVVRRGGNHEEMDFEMENRVFSQLGGVCYGMPGATVRKLLEDEKANDPTLAAELFNHFNSVADDKETLLRTKDELDDDGNPTGNRVLRAILPATWNPIPYEQSVETLINRFGSDKECHFVLNEDWLAMNFIHRKLDYEINPTIHDIGKRDDPYEWGVQFRDTDVLNSVALTMCPYTRRLICTNGATTEVSGVMMQIRHSGKDSSDPMGVQTNVRQAVELLDAYGNRVAETITASQGIMLNLSGHDDMPEQALARLKKDFDLTKLQDNHVREGWTQEGETIPEPSVYRLHNAFTRAGTHAEELSFEKRQRLQAIGGNILELAANGYNWN